MIPDVVIHFQELSQRLWEKTSLALMQERVFDKMGFGEINWLTSPEGHNTGGWGMYLTAGKILCTGTASASKR